ISSISEVFSLIALASLSNAEKCSWHIIYFQAQFVDYRELKGFTEKVIELVEKLYLKFIDIEEKPAEEEFKPINGDDALVKEANLAIAEYGLPKALSTLHQFSELLGKSINVKEIEDALDTFPDFLSEDSANLPCTIWVSYHKTLSNESEAKLKELEKFNFRIGQYQNI
ncbi:4666_t:CDS:2, partial [Scutellospora calospora]